ncbi:type II secretion system minor pseudopilin GspI [Marinomonas transparens]|uniref:Type II secretion system protein I n=1 Tax=Marinomonas transparens TaxID=2795388 RepID=A0A934JVJ3_9GAMM|nr:type II secretion system minor pseudopilin GspI [Marinomonas transparens]MBJ7539057.1 type II secretion system minor pseudopilin GspI [Marinomonas transparens]
MKSSSNNGGFSLIEVMIAVVILSSVSILAMKTLSTAIDQTAYLQQKMLAVWVAENRLTELRIALRLEQSPSFSDEEVEQGGVEWKTKLSIGKATGTLTRVEVDVYPEGNVDNPIYSLNSFVPTVLLAGAQ